MRASRALGFALVFALATAAVNAPASTAEAQGTDINTPFTGQRPFQLDIHAGFMWYGWGLATGARFGIPILNNGFIPSINNAVYINFGIDFYYIRCWHCRGFAPNDNHYGFGLSFPVALHWEFYLNDNWSFFAELGVNVFIHPEFFEDGIYEVYDGFYWFLAAAGGSFHSNDNILLTLRVGIPYVAFGLTFQF